VASLLTVRVHNVSRFERPASDAQVRAGEPLREGKSFPQLVVCDRFCVRCDEDILTKEPQLAG